MPIRAEPDERSNKRLGARPACAQRQQKGRSSERPLKLYGGVYGVRTRDLMAASHALYQLS